MNDILDKAARTFEVGADSGCVAVRAGNAVTYFSNGYGDGLHYVLVDDHDSVDLRGWTFVESYWVLEGTAEILANDCEPRGKAVGTLSEGFWMVYNDNGNVLFQRH